MLLAKLKDWGGVFVNDFLRQDKKSKEQIRDELGIALHMVGHSTVRMFSAVWKYDHR